MVKALTSHKTEAILAILAGVLVLVFDDLLRWVVGLFLIVHGILKLR